MEEVTEKKENGVLLVELIQMGHEDVSSGWSSRPDSAGGVSVRISFKNRSPITIKYITFTMVPYNSVGDMVSSSIGGKTEAYLKGTGPFDQDKGGFLSWGQVWYNHSITEVKLTKVEIEYMDGSSKVVDGSEIEVTPAKGGCYIATSVYGSYQCPQVWTLRRYRDNRLAKTWYGRAFIHTYYAISPTVVRLFGDTRWFHRFWRNKLDKLVASLNEEGISNTPYSDQ